MAETLRLACVFILGISELIFLVQQRDLKQTFSEKFLILEQIFDSTKVNEREREREREPSMKEAASGLPNIYSTLFYIVYSTYSNFILSSNGVLFFFPTFFPL